MSTSSNGRGVTVYIDGDDHTDMIEKVYNGLKSAKRISHSVDSIAYTEDFERVYERVRRLFPLTRNEVSVALMNLRKQGKCQAPNPRNKQQELV
jgi:cobalamin biosynthesis Co2+ chelatase CbiK